MEEDSISECPVCHGLWFEKGQLDSVKDDVLPETGWMEIDDLKEQFLVRGWTWNSFCPRCRDTAFVRIEDRHTKTEFCVCPQCKGNWLATGQFLNLVNLLLDEADEKSTSELAVIGLRQIKRLLTIPESPGVEWQNLKMVLTLLKERILTDNPALRKAISGLEKSMPL